ncbi:MAG: cobalamin-independent methionine synthase II family protein [Reyranella sp.]
MSVPPFRADHVGSLLRPAALRQAFRDRAAGCIDDASFNAIQDAAIRDAVRLQEQVGLQVVNDGEFRRGSYWGRFVERLQGLAIGAARFRFRDDSGVESAFTAPIAEAPLRRTVPLAADEVAFVTPLTSRTVKVTMPAPSTLHFYAGSGFARPGLYPDLDAYFAELAAIYRAEIADIARAGGRYIQFDEVALAMLCDPTVRELVRADGLDPTRLITLYVEALNQAIDGAPPGIVFAVHMCRGNFRGRYLSSGGYDDVAEQLFERAEVSHFLLEYDTPRAGDFSPLRHIPRNKGVVLGLVSSKVPALEPVDLLRRRIDEASRDVDIGRLGISPQCGFASTAAGNPLSKADMRAKLARCVEVANIVWG